MEAPGSNGDRAGNRELTTFFERDRFAHGNGIHVVEVRPGFARTEMTVESRHLNAVGILEGGALFTLADLAFAGASNSHGVLAVGVQTDVTWFRPVRSGRLVALAEEISRTHRISTCLIRVTDESGELVALMKGLAFIKGDPIAPTAPEA